MWSAEEKALIWRQARVPGISVGQVARRYDVNTNQVFTWLRDPRDRGEVPPGLEVADVDARSMAVELVASTGADRAPCAPVQDAGASRSLLEVDLVCGHRLRVSGSYDADALSRLIRSLPA